MRKLKSLTAAWWKHAAILSIDLCAIRQFELSFALMFACHSTNFMEWISRKIDVWLLASFLKWFYQMCKNETCSFKNFIMVWEFDTHDVAPELGPKVKRICINAYKNPTLSIVLLLWLVGPCFDQIPIFRGNFTQRKPFFANSFVFEPLQGRIQKPRPISLQRIVVRDVCSRGFTTIRPQWFISRWTKT